MALAAVLVGCSPGGSSLSESTGEAPESPPRASATTTTAAGIEVEEAYQRWLTHGVADYDLEYALEQSDSAGAYRSVVRDGKAVNCFLDDELSLRLKCDRLHYTVESLYSRLGSPGVTVSNVEFDPEWSVPLRAVLQEPDGNVTSFELLSFTTVDPIDWVAYVDDALAVLEANYSQPDQVNWDEVREVALSRVTAVPRRVNAFTGLISASDLVPGVLFRTAREAAVRAATSEEMWASAVADAVGEPPSGYRIGNVGYLQIQGAFPDQASEFAAEVHGLMRDIDADPVCGWVVDLREQSWSDLGREMLALGPLLGDGAVVTRLLDEEREVWSYMAGTVSVDGGPLVDYYGQRELDTTGLTVDDPYRARRADSPIAVLTAFETDVWPSLAFRALPGTRVFGQPTAGGVPVLSAAELVDTEFVLELPLGAQLIYRSFRSVDLLDRNGQPHEPWPDDVVLPVPESSTDEVLDAAVLWLSEQVAC
ncbi:MAG: hypothetical protein QNJ89_01755 [Acidimicrobiia bacterium]|nr:hypothetical protein [Acidimicrobiia bacterium]